MTQLTKGDLKKLRQKYPVLKILPNGLIHAIVRKKARRKR